MMLTGKSVSKKLLRLGLPKTVLVVLVFTHHGLAPMERSGHLAVAFSIESGYESDDLNANHTLSLLPVKPRGNDKNKTVQSAGIGTDADIGTYYRRTKNGWEDSSKWQIKSEPVQQQLDAIHPAIWTLLVLSLVLLVLFGCSTQSEIDRLFSDLDRYFGRKESGP